VTPTPNPDAFAVVRATSQAAYQAGQAELNRGDYLQACVDLDKAKTNDPDARAEIQQALDEAVAHGCTPATPVVQITSPPAAAPQRTLLVATIAAGVGTALDGTSGPAGTPNSGSTLATPQPTAGQTPGPATAQTPQPAVGGATLSATPSGASATAQPVTNSATTAAQPAVSNTTTAPAQPSASSTTAGATQSATNTTTTASAQLDTTPTPSASASVPLVPWTDPQGRFSIGAPAGWSRVDNPQSLVGTSVVEFHDPSGRAQVDVAVDSSERAVSPELYAASLELAMQHQVPGYASEQIVPGATAGSPSVQRVFTFTQRDSAGQDHQARGFQTAVVKGSTPYLISGTAPADQYQQFGPTFDQIVESFRFS
jgi:hypothetical protein